MSYRALNWAWELTLPSSQKMVLVAMADMSDENESCYPGLDRLARMAGTSKSTVQRAVNALVDAGLLVRERRHREGGSRTSNRYYLQVGSPLDTKCQIDQVSDRLSVNDDVPKVSSAISTPLIEPPVEPSDMSDLDRQSDKPKVRYSDSFEQWWRLYPRRESKADAFKAWGALRKEADRPSFEELMQATQRYVLVTAAEPQYRKLPAGWLRARKWEDELPAPGVTPGAPVRKVKKFQRREDDE